MNLSLMKYVLGRFLVLESILFHEYSRNIPRRYYQLPVSIQGVSDLLNLDKIHRLLPKEIHIYLTIVHQILKKKKLCVIFVGSRNY